MDAGRGNCNSGACSVSRQSEPERRHDAGSGSAGDGGARVYRGPNQADGGKAGSFGGVGRRAVSAGGAVHGAANAAGGGVGHAVRAGGCGVVEGPVRCEGGGQRLGLVDRDRIVSETCSAEGVEAEAVEESSENRRRRERGRRETALRASSGGLGDERVYIWVRGGVWIRFGWYGFRQRVGIGFWFGQRQRVGKYFGERSGGRSGSADAASTDGFDDERPEWVGFWFWFWFRVWLEFGYGGDSGSGR